MPENFIKNVHTNFKKVILTHDNFELSNYWYSNQFLACNNFSGYVIPVTASKKESDIEKDFVGYLKNPDVARLANCN